MNALNSGQQLSPGQSIASQNGQFTLTLQTDGNLVLYRGPTPLWNTATNGQPVKVATMQADGNFVLYDAAQHPIWASGTNGHPGASLTVQDDGNAVIYVGATPLWATNTLASNLVPPQHLSPGQSIASLNGQYNLALQADGNLVLYAGTVARWATGTNGKPVQLAAMQADGNLVLYDAQQNPLWASGTNGHSGAFLTVQNDGNLVIYDQTAPIWAKPDPNAAQISADGKSVAFNSGPLLSNLPLGGSTQILFESNGDFTFTCFAHDSGFDNIDYVLSAVVVTPPPLGTPAGTSGIAYTFQHLGGVEGTAAGLPFGTPRRDDSFTSGGANSTITNEWAFMPGAVLNASIKGKDATTAGLENELTSLLDSTLQELSKKAADAIIALV